MTTTLAQRKRRSLSRRQRKDPEVPDQPTQADAATALDELREVFADFPFPNEAERCAAISALLTILARPAILL